MLNFPHLVGTMGTRVNPRFLEVTTVSVPHVWGGYNPYF